MSATFYLSAAALPLNGAEFGLLPALPRGMDQTPQSSASLETKIHLIRGVRVMLDSDLAELYRVPTMRLNQAVRRNLDRFPLDFAFILTKQELTDLISQTVISSSAWGGRRKPTLAFTEQGIAMLSSVLRSPTAIQANIAIMRAFVQMRGVLLSNRELENKLSELESKYDRNFEVVFKAIRELMQLQTTPRRQIRGLRPSE